MKVLCSLFGLVESVPSFSVTFHNRKQIDQETLPDYSRVLMHLYARMKKAETSFKERRALQQLRNNYLSRSFVRGAREVWVQREFHRIEMAYKNETFLEMKEEVLDFFRD